MSDPRTVFSYNMIKGEPFERTIYVKDRRTHRVFPPADPFAKMRPLGTTGFGEYDLTAEVNSQYGISLSLTALETNSLTAGTYEFDVVATIGGESRGVAKGQIEVVELDRVTPIDISGVITVYLDRTNVITLELGEDVSADIFTSEIREEPNSISTLIATWDVTFTTDGTDGSLTLTLDNSVTSAITATGGYMDVKRVTGGEPVTVLSEPLEVVFEETVTS